MLKKLSPRVWLSVCGIGFGLVMVFQGLTHNYGGILATRFFLGLFECGMFPGCFYLLGMWYRRAEAQKRFTFFFCSTSLAGAFGGLLASAIGQSTSFLSLSLVLDWRQEMGWHSPLTYLMVITWCSERPPRVQRLALDLYYRGRHHGAHLHRLPLYLSHLVSQFLPWSLLRTNIPTTLCTCENKQTNRQGQARLTWGGHVNEKCSPETAKWLNEDERAYIKTRLEADLGRNAAERNITWRDVVNALRDPKVILGGFMYMGLVVYVSSSLSLSSSSFSFSPKSRKRGVKGREKKMMKRERERED